MSALTQSDLMILAGVTLIASYVGLVLFRKRAVRQESETEVAQLANQSLVLRRGESMKQTDRFDAEAVKENLRALTARSNNDSYVVHYINGLIDRHRSQVNIEVIKKAIEEAGVRIELINKVVEAKQAESRLHRVEQEETLKDEQLSTQLLEEQVKQEEARRQLARQRELADLQHEHDKLVLKKKLADLAHPEPAKDPVKEHEAKAHIETQKKIIDLRQQQEIERADRELKQETEEVIERKLRTKREELFAAGRYWTELAWIEDVRTHYKDRADELILEPYQEFRRRWVE